MTKSFVLAGDLTPKVGSVDI